MLMDVKILNVHDTQQYAAHKQVLSRLQQY
jgi:hypothetical protein